MSCVLLIFITSAIFGAVGKQNMPLYKDSTAGVEQRVNDLLSRMTLKEKIAQISHLHSWDVFDGQVLNMDKLQEQSADIGFGFFEGFPLTAESCRSTFYEIQKYQLEKTRLGIPAFAVAEALHGVVHEGCTIYPQNIAMGSTFNPQLAYEKAKHISGELNTMGIKQILAPCIDVVRDLRWGRVEESYSEDPFLCSMMAVAEVKGYMEHGISPMLKHYGPHGNPLGGLNLASVECGTRDLFDIYMKPFEAVIANTGIMAVMSSYNSWNRTPNSASYYMLTEILRNRFGFRGYVYSDWGVISMLKSFHKTAANDFEAASQAISAGLDVEASSSNFPALIPQIENGNFDITIVDRAVARVLRAKFELGLFEDPYLQKASYRHPLRAAESVSLSRQIADESTVLLKNDGNLLPLDARKIKSIAVIGPNADNVQFGDYTWSKNNSDGVTPLEGIKALVGDKVKINYAEGCSLASLSTDGFADALEAVRESDVAVVFVGSSSTAFVRGSEKPSTSGEGIDLHDISLTGAQEELIKQIHAIGKPVVVVMVAGKPFAIPWIKENIPAVVAQWYAGEQAGNSIADILFGKVNPSGKISFSFPQSTGHLLVYYNHLPSDKGYYKEPGTYEKPGRDYVFSNPDALWPFGHGLSYTEFEYVSAVADKKVYTAENGGCAADKKMLYADKKSHSVDKKVGFSDKNMRSVDKETGSADDSIKVAVTVKNVGKRAGKEVVQVYVRDVVSSVVTPVKQLKGFSKVELEPGESKVVEISIPIKELYLTAEDGSRYLEPGEFELMVGGSSSDIAHTITVYVGGGKGAQNYAAPANENNGSNASSIGNSGSYNTSSNSSNSSIISNGSSNGTVYGVTQITVSGMVRDVQATPIAGVKVYVEGEPEYWVKTDKAGNYSIKVNTNCTIIFQKAGYSSKSIKIDGQKSVNVVLEKGN